MENISDWSLMDVLPHLILVLITLVFLIILGLLWKPRLLILLIQKYLIFTSQFTQKSLRLGGDTWCSYLERGTTKSSLATVLLLHGLSGSSDHFLQMSALLNPAYHLVAIDHLNHGQSTIYNRIVTIQDMVEFVKKFVEKSGLNCRKFQLVGYSLGGCIATKYTATYPEDVASLILCCPFISTDGEFAVQRDFSSLNTNEDMQAFLDICSSGKMGRLPSILLTGFRHHRSLYSEAHGFVRTGLMKASDRYFLPPNLLGKISHNVLIIWGEDDKLLFRKGADYLKANIPSAKVEFVSEAGHLVIMTHAKEMAAILEDWLADQKVERLIRDSGHQKYY